MERRVADGARVLLIDDHAILRAGVGALIDREADLQVVGQAASIPEALEMTHAPDFDLIVADFLLAAGSAHARHRCTPLALAGGKAPRVYRTRRR